MHNTRPGAALLKLCPIIKFKAILGDELIKKKNSNKHVIVINMLKTCIALEFPLVGMFAVCSGAAPGLFAFTLQLDSDLLLTLVNVLYRAQLMSSNLQ